MLLVLGIASMVQNVGFFKKLSEKKLEAFEMWCYHQLLRRSWTDRKSNEWVLEMMDCRERLLTTHNR